ncbi:MAG: NAAT family transporter [Flavobacteriales bacterium]|nr:NAAT family transporter [Flavobacteriales bacterium]
MITLAASGLFQYLLITMAGILVIVNPLTTAFVFLALVPDATVEERRAIARRATLTATAVLVTFALMGGVIFHLFGITLHAFRIAGGIILFGIAMGMLGRRSEHRGIGGAERHDVSIIPLAIPFISGPGSIATVMMLVTEAPSIQHTVIVYLAIIITTVLTYFALVNSRHLVRYIGETGRQVITRIFGLILAVLAVQFVINGITDLMHEQLPEMISK